MTYLPRLVMETEKKKAFVYDFKEEFYGGDFDKILTESEKSRLIYIIMEKIKIGELPNFKKALKDTEFTFLQGDSENLGFFLKRNQMLKEMIPLFSKSKMIRAVRDGHADDPKNSHIMRQIWSLTTIYIDVKKIRDYYGDELAIYFEWMNFLQSWLLIPSAFAIFVWGSNQYIDIGENPFTGMFSIIMSLWGTVYLCSWRRHCKGLDILWDDYIVENDAEDLRKEFVGEPCINPITDKPDTYQPTSQKIKQYTISFIICFPCWCVCCLIIVAFLNATGVIRPDHHGGAFDIPELSHLADPGNYCDPEGNINMVVSIAQAIMTMIMNQYFRKVAIYTADMENHKTQRAYNNSIFIKRFIFEFTDFQLYLFYIGIYQMDIKLLRVNLISVFMVDEIRRVITEAVIPYLQQHKDEIQKDVTQKIKRSMSQVKPSEDSTDDSKLKRSDSSIIRQKDIIEEELAELEREEVEQFDDYLEMVMTFGYVVLFASSFPFGTTLTSLFIYIETKSDAFKMEMNARRPFSRKAHDIGTWELALDILSVGAVFTNIVLCCYATN
jgi:hypothetical protein